MSSLSDSEAFCDNRRMLAQHQTVLSSIQLRLSDPKLYEFNWLDLACGRGQIIAHLDKVLSPRERGKINFFGYDINQDSVNDTQRTADTMGLKHAETQIGVLSNFSSIYPSDLKFDYISLTNTIHEIHPKSLTTLLYDSLQRLSSEGCLYIYDLERISPYELGAVPWSVGEVKQIIKTALAKLGLDDYEPAVAELVHSTCNGWSVQIKRNYMAVTDKELQEKRHLVMSITEEKIRKVLKQKFQDCKKSLASLTNLGSENRKEADDREYLLYLFWALYRALEME